MAQNFPAQLRYWKEAILLFLKNHPQYIDQPTIGYIRFLEDRRILTKDEADKLCSYAALKEFCSPETYVRMRRELIEKGLVWQDAAQRELFQQQAEDTRQHYGQDKRDNPVWEDER